MGYSHKNVLELITEKKEVSSNNTSAPTDFFKAKDEQVHQNWDKIYQKIERLIAEKQQNLKCSRR